ncbi:MAG: glycosyltransferase family 4 protein [Nanoarchaeota archaeon]|nr:glycosyltransferase family 4 protein [Nanoarchaeota archaeon]
MKIGYLITYLGKRGAQSNCLYLAKEVAKKHDVTLFSSYTDDVDLGNVKLVKCKSLFKYKYYFVFNPGVFKILRYNLDVLHVHSFGFFFNDLLVILLKLFTKTKIVNTPHGPFMALSEYKWYERILKILFESFEYFVNKLYDVVIQVNKEQYKWMITKGVDKKKIKYVPNGIPESFLKNVEVDSFIEKYGLKNKFIISYLGGINRYKGMDQVIKVLPNLLKIKKNIVFLIGGKDFGDRKRLEKIVKRLKLEKNVLFLGEIDDVEHRQLYQVSEIFVLPSDWEAFGIVLLEAMAKNTAVISTRTEGGKFVVKEGENGCLFDYGNLKELETKFKVLFNDKLREKIKKNNFKKANEFTWEKVGKDLEKIYLKWKSV